MFLYPGLERFCRRTIGLAEYEFMERIIQCYKRRARNKLISIRDATDARAC
jgi:hypothetical protein